MIKFISDNHAFDFIGELESYKPENEDDLLIVLGDTCFKLADIEKYNEFDKWLLSRDYKIAVVEGNHENYEYLDGCKEEIWCGGKVNRINENVVRLRRGEIYTIEGNTFFAFGGCDSSEKWKAKGLWHEGDIPTREQLDNAYENLKKAGYKVDYVLTHKYFCNQCFVHPGENEHTLFMLNRFIDNNVSFKRWYSGHRHEDRDIDDKHRVVYNKLRGL